MRCRWLLVIAIALGSCSRDKKITVPEMPPIDHRVDAQLDGKVVYVGLDLERKSITAGQAVKTSAPPAAASRTSIRR
jgi:hypothetical protein